MIKTNHASTRSDRVARGRASAAAGAVKACLVAVWGAVLLLGCGGDATSDMPPEYAGPLAVECVESSDCPFTLGYATCWNGRCSVPCYGPGRTEDYSEACAAWGGTCVEWDGGQFWCGQ